MCCDDALEQRLKFIRMEWLVDLAPVHAVAGLRILHRELVARGAPGTGAGERNQGAIRSQAGLAAGNRCLHQLRCRQVAVDVRALHQLSAGLV